MEKTTEKTVKKTVEMQERGRVFLVGAGPGDGGLFTLKGKQLLEDADVVVYDKLVGQGVMALIPWKTELIAVGKAAGNHPVPQNEINQILLREALAGKKVVRLKGGDPFVFGRGGEELELLEEHGIPFEIVPGITSAVAVPAYNGIPVTHRDFCSSLHIITGHTKKQEEADIDYEALVRMDGTLVFLMGVTSMSNICKGLLAAGMRPDMPAAVLERGTTAHQRRVVSDVSHLSEAAGQAKVETPAIIVVGKVCTLAEKFHWAEDRPLGGLKIAVTRPRDRSSAVAKKLAALGAEVVALPTIETEELAENCRLEEELKRIGEYQWIAFTSPAGVKIFYEKMRECSIDLRNLWGIKIAAIGEGTKRAVEEKGIFVELMPKIYSGEELGAALARRLLQEKESGLSPKVLIPRAKIGTEDVIHPLKEAGVSFVDLPIYDTVMLESEGTVSYDETVDYVTFTSASTVRGFVKMNGSRDMTGIRAICIGPQTAREAEKYGMDVTISQKATIDSMVECLLKLKTLGEEHS